MKATTRKPIRAYSLIADAPHDPVHSITVQAGTACEAVHVASEYALLHFRIDGKLYTSNQHVSSVLLQIKDKSA